MNSINNNLVISIEGNIGSGKSTIIELLSQLSNENNFKKIVLLKEPVHEWEEIVDDENNSIISLFYQSQSDYGFSFQMMAYISRLNNLKKALNENHNSIIITERSLFTDKFVFAKMLYDDNKIRKVDYSIYEKWFNSFINDIPIVHKVIYINTIPELCLERIHKRSREGESNISLEYLTNCNKYHNDLIKHYLSIIDSKNFYIYNGNINHDAIKFNNLVSFIYNL